MSGQSGPPEIWMCESDGSNPVQLMRLGAAYALGSQWSPDGRKIAFEAVSNGNPDVYSVSANGGASRHLTTSPAADKWPYWSRDGQSIHFVSGSSQIWKMSATGGDVVRVTPDDGETRDAPQVSPDGRYVYYGRDSQRIAVCGGCRLQEAKRV